MSKLLPARTALAALVLALILAPAAIAGVSDEEWETAHADYKKKWASRKTRLEAVQVLAELDDKRAVEEMWKILTRMRPNEEIRETILEALGEVSDRDAIAYLAGRIGEKMKDSQRLVVLQALSKVDNADVGKAIVTLIEDDSAAVRTAALVAVGRMEVRAAGPKVIAALEDEHWQVRAAAIECCVQLMLEDAVPKLIDRLEKEDGRLEGDCIKALRAMTGKNKDTPLAWRAWWNNEGKEAGLEGEGYEAWQNPKATGTTAQKGDGDKGGSVATYYGIKIYSKRLIFVIDMSGSMKKKYTGARPKQEKVTVTLTGQSDGKKPPKKRTATLDWTKIRTKWELAREQLIFTLEQLAPETQFSIIYYGRRVKLWRTKLVPATRSNVKLAIKKLRDIDPEGATNIHGALKKAFQIGGNTEADKVELTGGSSVKKGGDTIFFLTDGWPTVGKVIGVKKQGTQVKGWLPKMMAEIAKWNTTRRLKIHCIGVGKSHCKKLMREISETYGGDYIIAGQD